LFFTIFGQEYIAATNVQLFGHLPLCVEIVAIKTVAQHENFLFAGIFQLAQHVIQLLHANFQVNFIAHSVIDANHVHQCQRVTLIVHINGITHADVLRTFFLCTKMHKDFIVNAPRGVRRQSRTLANIEGVDRLNQPDCAHGNQVVLFHAVGVVFLNHMHHQPQVVLNELISCKLVACGMGLQIFLFLRSGQRRWKRPRVAQMQRKNQKLRRNQFK